VLAQSSAAPAVSPVRVDPLTTDRPDFTEASSTVGRGRLQLETGYTFSRNREQHIAAAHALPEALVRIGVLTDAIELRVGQSATRQRIATVDGASHTTTGFTDLYLGAKLALRHQSGVRPEVAVVLQSTLPTGHRNIGSPRALPGVNLLYGWEITRTRASLGASSQINATCDDGAHSAEFAQSLTVGYELTQRLGVYTESYAIKPLRAPENGSSAEAYANGGFRLLLSPNMQLDLRVGFGLTRVSDDQFFGLGFSVRR
jgi:Putative MetA-pathway of phenol degradation